MFEENKYRQAARPAQEAEDGEKFLAAGGSKPGMAAMAVQSARTPTCAEGRPPRSCRLASGWGGHQTAHGGAIPSSSRPHGASSTGQSAASAPNSRDPNRVVTEMETNALVSLS